MQLLRRLAASIAAAALALSGGLPVVTAGAIQLGAPAIAAAASLTTPVVRDSVLHDTSGPLASLPPFRPPFGDSEVFEPERPDLPDRGSQPADPVRQAAPTGTSAMPAPNLTFETERDADNFPFVVEPPDPNIDVGPNHVVQTVNSTFAVYDKKGALLLGPLNINTLWQTFGVGSGDPASPACAAGNAGDPIVQYDQLADRWMISQFAFSGSSAGVPTGPYFECIAVSTGPDPLQTWNRYEFLISATLFDDYPHFGVWPDAYYMSINQFDETANFDYAGPGAVAFERDKMLQGQQARMVYFDLSSSLGPQFGGQLPGDLDGKVLPPAGSPDVFAEADDDAAGFASDRLNLFNFHVDWTTPANSSYSGPSALDVAAFDSVFTCADVDGDGAARNCIPGKDGPGVDAISDRLMFRVAYRNIGGHEALVVNHTVDVNNPAGHAGIRWYELRKTATTAWGIFQQGTYAPDAMHRWMGSAAMDKAGNIAIGYSLSSPTTYPAIAYAGRLAGDPAGQLAQGEVVMFQGTGSEGADGGGRWGDYTSLVVDPSNDCTFWYTNEYYQTNGTFDWHTRTGSFTFPSCLGTGADMGVTTAATAPPIRVGTTFQYVLSVANNGPDSAPSASLVDTLPASATLLSVTTTTGKCSGTATVTCKLGTMARGASATVTLTLQAPARPASLTNTASVSSGKKDPNPINNTSKVTLDVVDTCTPPGVLAADDTSDSAPNISPVPATDVRSLWVGEPHQSDGVSRLAFTLSVGGPGSLPVSSQWYILWNRPTADATADRNYVAMKTDALGTASFEYGSVSPPASIPPSPDNPGNVPTRRGAAVGSYDATTGILTITVPNSVIDGVSAGSVLGELQARAFLARADGGPVTQAASTDFGPISLYRLVGNC